jgi:hypothetical protein
MACPWRFMFGSIEELLEDYKKFQKRSHRYYSEFYERVKADRNFLSGKHFDETDDKRFGKSRLKGQVDIISNTIRAIANQYNSSPYTWVTSDELANDLASNFLNETNVKSNIAQGLKNAIGLGLGYIVLSTDVNRNGEVVPTLYSVPKVTNVFYDPDSAQIDGSDACKCIIVDIKSKDYIRSTYGDEFVTEKNKKPLFDIDEEYSEDELPIITYYVKSKGSVTVYKLLNSGLIEDPVELVLDRLPVIPIYGEEVFIDDKLSYQGIVRQTKSIQKLVDYSYSQLCERLAKSPKNAWIGTKEALEGYEEYYKNFDKSVNPLLIYNKYDGAKKENQPPQRQDMTIQYADLTTVLQTSLNFMQSITGISSVGIPDQKGEISATEALLNAKSYTNNIRNFFDNLKESFKSAGFVFMQLMGLDLDVRVEQGPEDQMSRQVARAELMQLAQLVPEEKRMDLVGAITSTLDDNQFIRKFNMAIFDGVSPEIVRMQQQMQQMQQDFQQQLQQANSQNQELNQQLQQAQMQIIAMENSNKTNVVIEQMRIQADLQKEAMRLQASAEGDEKDRLVEMEKEAMKQQNENARFAKKLQQENVDKIVEVLA